MGLAYLNGGGGGGGIRHKRISIDDYNALSAADKQNPYVIWIIDDMKAQDLGGAIVEGAKIHVCTWEAYSNLSVDDQKNPKIMWIISNKNVKDLQALGFGANEETGSKLYNISAELDQAELVKTVNALIDRVNDMSMALKEIADRLNASSDE